MGNMYEKAFKALAEKEEKEIAESEVERHITATKLVADMIDSVRRESRENTIAIKNISERLGAIEEFLKNHR